MDPTTTLTSQLIPGSVQATQILPGYGTQSIPQPPQTAQGYGIQSIPQVGTLPNIQTTQYQTNVPTQTMNTIVTSAPTTQTFQITENPTFTQTTFTPNVQEVKEVNNLPPLTDFTNLVNIGNPQTTFNTVVTQENQIPTQITTLPEQVNYTINQPITQEVQTTTIADNNVVTNQFQVTPEPTQVFDTGLTLGNVEPTPNLNLQPPTQYSTTTTQQVITKEFKVVNPNISVVPMPILPPPQEKVIVKVPKIQRVIVPKVQRVVVPSKKTVLVNRQAGLPYSTASLPYGTGSIAVPTASVAPAVVPRPVVPLATPGFNTLTRPLPFSTLSQPIVPGSVVTPLAPRPVVPVTPLAPRPVVPFSTASVIPGQVVPRYNFGTYNPLAARGLARPALYNTSSFRPAVTAAPANNLGFTGKYTTRTYNARRL